MAVEPPENNDVNASAIDIPGSGKNRDSSKQMNTAIMIIIIKAFVISPILFLLSPLMIIPCLRDKANFGRKRIQTPTILPKNVIYYSQEVNYGHPHNESAER